MSETPGAFDFIDSLLRGDVAKANGTDNTLEKIDEVAVKDSSANEQSGQSTHVKTKSHMEILWDETEKEAGKHMLDESKIDDLLFFGNPSDVKTASSIPGEGIDEIEVIDGMALLHEDVKEDIQDLDEVVMETGVEEGQPLHPSQRGNYIGEIRNFPVENVQGTYYVDNNLKISHFELMVGGPIPSDPSGKDDLIKRLRLFIHELHNHLEKSEDKRNVLKREYSKKMMEVKESEELVEHLTGQLTEQASAIQKQMVEVEHARSSSNQLLKKDKNFGINEDFLPYQLAMISEGMTDEQLARKLAEEERSKLNAKKGNNKIFSRQQSIVDEVLAKDAFPGFTYKLTIKKPPLGFTLEKTKGSKFCKVDSISRNDLKKSGLVSGLQILTVNNIKLKNKSLPQVLGILESQPMPVQIRLRRELTPWKQYTEFQTTSWGTKKAVTTWTFYCSKNKPRIVVLEHNQRKGKSKRKVLIDGEIRYERKSTEDSFKFSLENDVIYVSISKDRDGEYTYELQINESSFYDAMTKFVVARTDFSAASNYV